MLYIKRYYFRSIVTYNTIFPHYNLQTGKKTTYECSGDFAFKFQNLVVWMRTRGLDLSTNSPSTGSKIKL